MFFVTFVCTLFASCTQNDDVLETIDGITNENGYVYTLHLDGGAPVYSEDMTRASTTWKSGNKVNLRFKSGSSVISGTATYNGSKWTMTTDKKLSTTTKATECGALYYENATDLKNLTPSSIVYMGEGTYTASSTDIYVTVTMKPITGRLRFKGTAGTRISVKGSLTCPKEMSTSTNKLTWETQHYNFLSIYPIELKVNSNGYTDYIYVTFDYQYNRKNILTIQNETEGKTYERLDIDGNILSVGGSGYLTIPTSSNFASLKWDKIDTNATMKAVNYLPLYDGVVTAWDFGSSAYSFYMKIYETLKDDSEILEDIAKNNTLYDVADKKDYIWGWSHRKSDTQYYLCSVAYNKDGERGPLSKQLFTTRSETEPRAIISNLKATTSNGNKWQFDVSLANGAVKYYQNYWDDIDNYNEDDMFLAYWTYQKINNGTISTTYNKTSDSVYRSGKQIAIVLVAVDSKGNVCGYSVAKATTDSKNSTVQKKSRSEITGMSIPKMVKSIKPEIR